MIIEIFQSPKANTTYVLVADDYTTNNSAIFKFNGTNQLVNNSLCHISSLEVYRGREQAIEISHQGFSVSNNGNIEVYRCITGACLYLCTKVKVAM